MERQQLAAAQSGQSHNLILEATQQPPPPHQQNEVGQPPEIVSQPPQHCPPDNFPLDFGEECEQLIRTVAHCRKVYPEACSDRLIEAKRLELEFVKNAEIKIKKKDDLQEIASVDVDVEKLMSDALEMCATADDISEKLEEVASNLKDISDVLNMKSNPFSHK